MSVNAILQGQQKPITTDTRTTLDGVLMGNGSTVDTMTVDAIPIDSSTNLVTSGGVKVAIDNLEDGTIPVALAENLTSDSAQSSADTFIERTTGGTASLSDGDGWIQLIRGTHTHTGYTPGSAVMTVTPAYHSLTASIVEATFLSQVSGNSGTKVFSYNNGWNETLATYGITLTNGTSPINGDYIQVDWEIIEDVVMTVTSSEEDITAEINDATFLGQVSGDSGTMTFSYTSSWDTNPTSYGITITGTPTEGDSISVDWTITRTVTMAVVPIIHTLSATINDETFLGQMSSASGTFSFNYTTGWSPNPVSYGITITGSPISGDSILVTYVKEVRGTITQSNPLAFKSSGWNLYDHSKGYARVLKYSDTYGFGISGTYTSLKFSTTTTGGSTITVTDGRFTIPSDGYVIVTGGNDTDTQIWMTWSDWTSQANGGTWEAYAESTVDFSSLMGSGHIFPYGLCEVGSYRDEINFSSGVAIQNVGRVNWSTSNLATVRTYGTDYEYDENYIYYGLSAPVTTTISINNTVKAYDHGVEWFTNTTQEVYAQTLYGTNLKNKLERDVVTISQQNIEPDGQKQVKQNIGAIDGVNENLLDNWYFVGGGSQQGGGQFPINQRGATSYSAANYMIDRWVGGAATTQVTINANSIQFSSSTQDSVAYLMQYVKETLVGKTVTISAIIDGQLQVNTGTVTAESNLETTNLLLRTLANGESQFRFKVASTTGVAVYAAKLEFGDQQTLAQNLGTTSSPNWVLNETPNYATELLKCVGAMGDSNDPYANRQYPFGLTHNLTFYVDGNNGDDTNDGLSLETPFLTINKALSSIPADVGGKYVTILLMGGSEGTSINYGDLTITEIGATGITITRASTLIANTQIIFEAVLINNDCVSSFTLDGVTITKTSNIYLHNRHSSATITNCIFDGGRIDARGPYTLVSNCTFRNLETNYALGCQVGTLFASGITIENSVVNGVHARQGGIIHVSTDSLTNNATNPYTTLSSGRIFVGNQEYGGPPQYRPNLLDNWYFINRDLFPINQRAQSTYTYSTATYTIDRWKLSAGSGSSGSNTSSTLTLSSTAQNGITLSRTSSVGTAVLSQVLTNALAGQMVTASIFLGNGSFYAKTGTMPSSSGSTFVFNFTDTLKGMYVVNGNEFRIISEQNSVVINAVKLEFGSSSSLLYYESGVGLKWCAQPKYQQELAKCQRFFVRMQDSGAARAYGAALTQMSGSASNKAYASVIVPVRMRATPSVTATVQVIRGFAGSTAINTNAVTVDQTASQILQNQVSIGVAYTDTNTKFPVGANMWILFTQLDLSAEP